MLHGYVHSEGALHLNRHRVGSVSEIELSMYRRSLVLGGLMATHHSTPLPSASMHCGPKPALARSFGFPGPSDACRGTRMLMIDALMCCLGRSIHRWQGVPGVGYSTDGWHPEAQYLHA